MKRDASICPLFLAVVFAWSLTTPAAAAGDNYDIVLLSNRADMISGGDALVELIAPPGIIQALRSGGNVRIEASVDGVPVPKDTFALRANGRVYGVIKGLKIGENVLAVRMPGKNMSIVITNHPIGGPVFSGPQVQPWICATPTAVPAVGNTPASNASGLTTFAVDSQCNIATEYKLFYRTTTPGCSSALPDPSPPAVPSPNNCFKPYTLGTTPADLATTTTTTGLTVPYIVRVERGTLNRGIYDIAVLFDTTQLQPWTPVAPQAQWNGKVVYTFGASTGQPRLQFRTEQNWADDSALSRGFMVVDNSLTDSLYNSNRVLVAETVMMMKEHIVDSYGEIKYLLGNGCSGGSIQQNTVASIFPGLLDGIQPSCDFSDAITTNMEVIDCLLLVNLYAGPEWTALMAGLTQTQINDKKTAINGHLDQRGCHSWNNAFGFNGKPGNYVPVLVVNQTTGALAPVGQPRNNCLLPAALVYDPVSNPNGTRCGDPDLATSVWGSTAGIPAGSTRARHARDNVGVQYGLKALIAGAITPEEFITLNEKIGGIDADSNRTPARSVADLPALDIAYASGIVSGGANLGKLPIIDSRGFDEQGIHYIWRTFSERARIEAANGGEHGNQVIWRYGTGLLPATPAQVNAVTLESFLTMDDWLSSLLASAPKASLNAVRTQAEVIAAKPVDAFDLCYLTGDTTFSTEITDMAQCDADPRLVKHASPRQVAGGALTEDILKCQLKPLNFADYAPVTFNAAQQARLQTAFPGGVCDWTKPGVGQQAAIGPLTFEDGPGGEPFGPPPPVLGPGRNR